MLIQRFDMTGNLRNFLELNNTFKKFSSSKREMCIYL